MEEVKREDEEVRERGGERALIEPFAEMGC